MESPPVKSEKALQVCTITVVFPVVSDEQAIGVKQKIGEAISDNDDARIDFRITNIGRPRV